MWPEPIPLRDKLYGKQGAEGVGRFHEGDRHLHLAYDEEEDWNLLAGCLTSQQVRLRDGSVQTIVHATKHRQKLLIKLSISQRHSIRILGQPVPVLTL